MNLRRLLPALVALVFVGVGVGVGALVFGSDDGGDDEPAITRVITADEIPEPCRQTLLLGNEALNAAARAIAVAQAAATAAPGSPSAPTEAVVAEAVGQAQALRQQYGAAHTACEQAQGAMASSTTTASTSAP